MAKKARILENPKKEADLAVADLALGDSFGLP